MTAPVKTKILTFTVVRVFPRENMMIARYGKETYMVEYVPGSRPGDGVEFEVEILK
mgnify:CR=1 FL=1